MNGILKLKGNSNLFKGILYGDSLKNKKISGELVFTTSLVGYNESITDPSYKNQILVFTNPLIGNYGVPSRIKENNLLKYFESDKIHVSGIVVGNYSTKYSHWNAIESLDSFCKKNNVPLLSNIDTRMLTMYLRNHGTTNGEISSSTEEQNSIVNDFQIHPIIQVSTKKVITYNSNGKIKICLIDCGTKNNIIRCLINRNCQVDLIPYNTDISNNINYHGIIIGNGPGDTSKMNVIIENIRKITLNKPLIPIFGICAGHQLLALSAGFDIYKMKFGHRSHNAPVLDTFTKKCYITSQNHGYCIKNTIIPNDWNISFINLNDNTIEGIEHKFKPYFSVQFHPEAKSGTKDTEFLFDKFVHKCKEYKSNM